MDLDSSTNKASVIILAVPSNAIREVLEKLKDKLSKQILIFVSKGLEKDTMKRSSEIAEELEISNHYGVLAGPTFAKDMLKEIPIGFTLATKEENVSNIVKEIFIILLLCIAVCLVFGVIFYDYIPNNKVVPSTVEAYKTSNTIRDEISQEIVDYPKQNITLEITDSDLTIKKQDKSYESGKANPFSSTTSSASGNTTENTTTPSGNNNTNKNPDSTDHYFNNISGK